MGGGGGFRGPEAEGRGRRAQRGVGERRGEGKAGRGDTHLADKGDEVVLAEALDVDVLDDDHLVVALVEEGVVDEVADVDVVATGEEEEGVCIAGGRVDEALAVGVLADALEQGADGAAHALEAVVGAGGVVEQAESGAEGCVRGRGGKCVSAPSCFVRVFDHCSFSPSLPSSLSFFFNFL